MMKKYIPRASRSQYYQSSSRSTAVFYEHSNTNSSTVRWDDITNKPTFNYIPFVSDDKNMYTIPDRKVKSDLGFVGNLEGTARHSETSEMSDDSHHLNGRADYYHPENANNETIDWIANILRANRIGVNTNNPTDAMHVIGDTRTSGTFYGANSEISGKSKASKGEFDELTVHGPLNIHELVANQTRVTNGDLWIQNNCKIASIYKESETEFIFATDTASLRVDDLCIIQVQRANGLIHRIAFKVIAYNDSLTVPYRGLLISGDVVDANSWDLFFAGDLIVQVGNTSIKSRQSSVLNCVSFGGYGAATLYYANVDTIPVGSFYPATEKITSAIGDLRELGLGSAAVYTTDGNFKGTIQADSGRINGCLLVGSDDLVGITGRNLGVDPTFQPSFFAGISELEAYHALEGDYGGFEEIPFSVIGKRGSSIFSIAKMRRCTSEDMYVTGRYRRMTNPIQWDSQGIFLYGNRIGTDTLNMSLSSDYSVVIHNAANTMGGIYINEPTDIAYASGTVITLHVFNYDRGIHTIQPKVKLNNLTIGTISNLPLFTLSQFESCAYTIKYARELTEIGLSGWVVLSAQKFTKQ